MVLLKISQANLRKKIRGKLQVFNLVEKKGGSVKTRDTFYVQWIGKKGIVREKSPSLKLKAFGLVF
jgi:hypothetical protein